MPQPDTITRFLIENHDVRGALVVLEDTVQQILSKQDYPDWVQTLLGEAAVAALLMSTTLKIEGSTALQARGEGPLRLLMAEATHTRTLRGIARWDRDALPEDGEAASGLAGQLGAGAALAITLTPTRGQRYQGIVPLERPNLGGCLVDYFRQSEQLETGMWLFHDGARWGGLLLQQLPGPASDERRTSWEHVLTLGSTITANELLNLPASQVIHRLFHEESTALLGQEPTRFWCNCSRDRTEEVLLSMGEAAVREILAELGEVEVVCQFCHQVYHFTPAQVEQIFRGHSLH